MYENTGNFYRLEKIWLVWQGEGVGMGFIFIEYGVVE